MRASLDRIAKQIAHVNARLMARELPLHLLDVHYMLWSVFVQVLRYAESDIAFAITRMNQHTSALSARPAPRNDQARPIEYSPHLSSEITQVRSSAEVEFANQCRGTAGLDLRQLVGRARLENLGLCSDAAYWDDLVNTGLPDVNLVYNALWGIATMPDSMANLVPLVLRQAVSVALAGLDPIKLSQSTDERSDRTMEERGFEFLGPSDWTSEHLIAYYAGVRCIAVVFEALSSSPAFGASILALSSTLSLGLTNPDVNVTKRMRPTLPLSLPTAYDLIRDDVRAVVRDSSDGSEESRLLDIQSVVLSENNEQSPESSESEPEFSYCLCCISPEDI